MKRVWTYNIIFKNIFFQVSKMWKKSVKIEIELELSALQIDDRGKYVIFALKNFCKEEKVVIEFTSPYTTKQNSIAKRSWHILDNIKNAMFADSKFSKEFWAEVMKIIAYLKNLLLISSKEKVPEELWDLKRQDVNYLIVFKFLPYVDISKKKRKKLEQKI